MTRDLFHDLHDLAARHSTAVPDGGLDVAALTGRTRRRRRVRAAAVAAASATAAVVLAAGAALASRLPTPPPPAQTPSPTSSPGPSASTSPEPAPTTTSVVLPPGDPTAPFGACGALADAPAEGGFAATWRTHAELGDGEADPLDAAVVAAGDALRVSAWLLAPEVTSTIVGFDAAGPRLSVLRDGVVVAGGVDLYRGTDLGVALDPVWSESADVVPYHGDVALVVCDPGTGTTASVGSALPPGDYELVAWTPVVDLGTSELPAELYGDMTPTEYVEQEGLRWLVARGEPVPFTVSDRAPTAATPAPAVAPWTAGQVPTCGDPAPTTASPGGLRLETASGPPATVAVGDEIALEAWLRYDGEGRVRFSPRETVLVVSRDGVVVGSTLVLRDGMTAVVDLGTATASPAGVAATLTACSPDDFTPGEPLPAGTYTVHPVAHGVVSSTWTPATGLTPRGEWVAVVGDGFEVVVR
ncbi:hypothetical protein [Cellulomonas fimi]|uniref:hypothetical protein n=1 Tax=Cellulomonas fimi TaxID=1708 RepID=UPI00235967FD|nr:hypothetical protein [Cellulomonas fimi]